MAMDNLREKQSENCVNNSGVCTLIDKQPLEDFFVSQPAFEPPPPISNPWYWQRRVIIEVRVRSKGRVCALSFRS